MASRSGARVVTGGRKGTPELTEDEKIVKEARERFKRCEDFESTARSRYLDDTKFYYGDSDNGYQWPDEVKKNRDLEQRPVLTINKTRQFCLSITNDAKQNKSQIKCRPVGQRATYDGAQVMEGLLRYIEYRSNAQSAYDGAIDTAVRGGIGYWRVLTEYVDQDSFDQDLRIRRIRDPLSVYLDPDIVEVDGSDAKFGFIFDDVSTEEFETEHPDLKTKIGASNLVPSIDWIDKDHVRICEYLRRKEKKTRLIAFTDPASNETKTLREDKIPKEILKPLLEDPTTRTRPVVAFEVEWFKIAGDQIIERGTWHGTTIPIVRVIGEESIIEGKLDRRGHVRFLKDPARMYNYWSSSAVEHVALQGKSPWIATAEAIEGYETYWNTANTTNHSVLPYNGLDEQGKPIPPPSRPAPPVMPDAYIKGLGVAAEEMRMVTGQYADQQGEQTNAVSGVAVARRQGKSDNATFHFLDSQAAAIAYTGRICLEVIPKIYDTKRVLKIMGEDGTESDVTVDPSANSEVQKQDLGNDKVKVIYNPGFAQYSVQAGVGAAYATRRQEAFTAFTQIIAQNPDLMKVAGDLMFRAADFPLADELAERLKRMVPPELLGKGPSPQVQQLLQQNQQLQQTIQTMMAEYAELKVKKAGVESGKEIQEFQAITDRMKVLLDRFNPNEIAQFTAKIVLESMANSLQPAPGADGTGAAPAPAPAEGAPAAETGEAAPAVV